MAERVRAKHMRANLKAGVLQDMPIERRIQNFAVNVARVVNIYPGRSRTPLRT